MDQFEQYLSIMPYILQNLQQDSETGVVFIMMHLGKQFHDFLIETAIAKENFIAIGIFTDIE